MKMEQISVPMENSVRRAHQVTEMVILSLDDCDKALNILQGRKAA